jgi:hypothetical protein
VKDKFCFSEILKLLKEIEDENLQKIILQEQQEKKHNCY